MISIQQLRNICDNSKFKNIKLPSSPNLTQPTYFESKIKLYKTLEKQLNINSINSINSIINDDSIKHKINIINSGNNVINNLECSFGDFTMNSNANKLAPELSNITESSSNINYDNILSYAENEKLMLFGNILDLFTKNNVLSSNNINHCECYFYGFKNPDSFIKSIMLLDNPGFIIKNKYEIQNAISSYKNEFSIHFESMFRDNYYHLIPGFKESYKVARRNFIRKPNYISNVIIQCYCDVNKKKLLILHLDNDVLSFSVYTPNIIHNKYNIKTLNNIEYDGIILEKNSVYVPFICPNTSNKLNSSVFTVCYNNIEFINKTQYEIDYESIKQDILNYKSTLDKPKICSKLERELNTPTHFLVENNEKRMHKIRLQKKKELYAYEEITDFTELDKAKTADTTTHINSDNEDDDNNSIIDISSSNDNDNKDNIENKTQLNQETIKLNAINLYKLQDLQNLMAKYNLDFKKQSKTGKMINKTKQECYDILSKHTINK